VIDLRPLGEEDRRWAVAVETESWGEPFVARRGELVDLAALPAFVAFLDGKRAGLWLVTTNDNTHALRFFQRWGLDLVASTATPSPRRAAR
jgi:hypothetical protein